MFIAPHRKTWGAPAERNVSRKLERYMPLLPERNNQESESYKHSAPPEQRTSDHREFCSSGAKNLRLSGLLPLRSKNLRPSKILLLWSRNLTTAGQPTELDPNLNYCKFGPIFVIYPRTATSLRIFFI